MVNGFMRGRANDGIHGEEIETNPIGKVNEMKRTYYRILRKFNEAIGGDHYTARFLDTVIQTALFLTAALASVAFFVWVV